VRHGYWFAAYLDLLGVRRALLRADFIPGGEPKEREALVDALKASVGAIRNLRSRVASYLEGQAKVHPDALKGLTPEQAEQLTRLRATQITRRDTASDGILLACSLVPSAGHFFPARAVHAAIGSCCISMLLQLADRRPIRGGLDVGTGVEVEGEFFGAALVKAYELESGRAGYPRLVVGDDLVAYLNEVARTEGDSLEAAYERQMANGALGYLKRDIDGEWIADYAGSFARRMAQNGSQVGGYLDAGRRFAQDYCKELETRSDDEARKLFPRYSLLVRYLEGAF
jgi:hypothetical protein